MSAPVRPPGLPDTLDYPEVPVGAVLVGSARRYGERVAFHHEGRELTFAELLAGASRVAHGLLARGIGRGDVVAVHMPNCLDYPAVYYGILLTGATFSPTNPLLPPDDLAAQLTDAGAAAVVTWGPAAAVLAKVRGRVPARLVVGVGADLSGCGGDAVDLAELTAGQPAQPPQVDIDVHRDLAHLAYTGGTTGRSKGVRLPHRNVVVNALQYACWGNGCLPAVDDAGGLRLEQVGPPEEWPTRLGTAVAVNLTPWFHAMGTIGYLNVPLLTGTTSVIHMRFDPGAYLADAERFRVTGIGGAPPVFVALLAHPEIDTRDLSSVRGIASGAAPLPVEVIEALRRRFPEATIGEGYGLTEVTMGATANPSWRSGQRKVGTVGVPVFDTEVAVVSPETGERLPAGEPGEVWLRGPQVMEGYHERPEETAAVLTDGWLRTGDVGVLDDEGYLSIVDRTKDMLIYKGYNVYPRELEELLFTHPAVGNAAVVGRRDPAVGELPVAFVVARREVSPDELMAFVNERVVPYKRLREVRLVESIPVSAAGKILRRELRRTLEED